MAKMSKAQRDAVLAADGRGINTMRALERARRNALQVVAEHDTIEAPRYLRLMEAITQAGGYRAALDILRDDALIENEERAHRRVVDLGVHTPATSAEIAAAYADHERAADALRETIKACQPARTRADEPYPVGDRRRAHGAALLEHIERHGRDGAFSALNDEAWGQVLVMLAPPLLGSYTATTQWLAERHAAAVARAIAEGQ